MPPTDHDAIALLTQFVSGSAAISTTSAAKAVESIVHQVTQLRASKQAVNSARQALMQMCKQPCVTIVPSLLSMCQNPISFNTVDVDVFVLSSAAWKAIVAACRHPQSVAIPFDTKFRILFAALRGVQAMFTEMLNILADDQHSTQHAAVLVARSLKIARFHTVNAARCAKAFADTDPPTPSQVHHQLIVDTLRLLLQVTASITLLCNFLPPLSAQICDDIAQNVCPALGAMLRSVIYMAHVAVANNTDVDCAKLILQVLRSFSAHETRSTNNSLRMSAPLLRIVAILHLMRLASCEIPGRTCEQQERKDATIAEFAPVSIAVCRTILQTSLVPLLFDCFDSTHQDLTSRRERKTGVSLLDWVVTTAAESSCLMYSVHNCAAGSVAFHEFLYIQISASNSIRAYVSTQIIRKIASVAHESLDLSSQILHDVLSATQLALAISPLHAERRWIPLLVQLAVRHVSKGRDMCNMIQDVTRNRESTGAQQVPLEPLTIRLVAALCDVLKDESSDTANSSGVTLQERQVDANVLTQVLQSFGIEKKKLEAFVKSVLLANCNSGILADASISLLPHVLDARSASGAALACLKRQTTSKSLICGAINCLSPSSMSASAIKAVCTEIHTAIQKHGIDICVPTAAFVARASLVIHENVSMDNWCDLSSLLERAVVFARECVNRGDCRDAALSAAVMFHAAATLSVTGSIPPANTHRKTHATLPSGILSFVEESLARVTDLRKTPLVQRNVHLASEEYFVKLEQCLMEKRDAGKGNSAVPSDMLRKFRDVHNGLLHIASGLSHGIGVWGNEVGAEVEQIKAVLEAFEAYTKTSI